MARSKRARKTPMHRRRYAQLSPRHRATRRRAFEVSQRMRRKGYTLARASRDLRISAKTVRRHLGPALRKRKGRWALTGRDRVSRALRIIEHGTETIVEVPDFENASRIGKYYEIVRRFLDTGDRSILREAQKIRHIRDIHGKTHTLELRPEVLYRIGERRAEPEFFQLYHQ